jgi:hypothetical protein
MVARTVATGKVADIHLGKCNILGGKTLAMRNTCLVSIRNLKRWVRVHIFIAS